MTERRAIRQTAALLLSFAGRAGFGCLFVSFVFRRFRCSVFFQVKSITEKANVQNFLRRERT